VNFTRPFVDVPVRIRAEATRQLEVLAATLKASPLGGILRQKYTAGGISIDVRGWRFVHRLDGDQVQVDEVFPVNGDPS
jgi:hypothetical protein